MQRLRQLIPSVHLDKNGVFKYIQISLMPQVDIGEDVGEVVIVRGYSDCAYHADILDKFVQKELNQHEDLRESWQADCPGGGRIEVNEAERTLLIYGYSQGFGRADHAVTKIIIEESMPDYTVTWNNEGY